VSVLRASRSAAFAARVAVVVVLATIAHGTAARAASAPVGVLPIVVDKKVKRADAARARTAIVAALVDKGFEVVDLAPTDPVVTGKLDVARAITARAGDRALDAVVELSARGKAKKLVVTARLVDATTLAARVDVSVRPLGADRARFPHGVVDALVAHLGEATPAPGAPVVAGAAPVAAVAEPVAVAASAPPAEPAAQVEAAPVSSSTEGGGTLMWIAWSGAGACALVATLALATGGALGAWAWSESSTVPTLDANDPARDALAQSSLQKAMLADVGYGAGTVFLAGAVVLAGTAAYLTLVE
jgi:hypothetical protein